MTVFTTFVEGLPRLPPKSTRVSKNPIAIARSISALQWGFFLSGLIAWMADAADFFCTSLSLTRLSVYFGQPLSAITTSITLTLLFRSLGAVIGGMASDRYGRKWPMVINLLFVATLSLGTAYVTTFSQFLAVRSLFGIAMGGVWSHAVATSLENLPVEARGIASGFLQEGYAIGYLLIAVVNLYLVPQTNQWQSLFQVAAGISLAAALIRLALPESQFFIDRRNAELASGVTIKNKNATFIREVGRALRLHWRRCIFAVIFMAAFNFLSHGSQDLYPSIIQSKGFSAHDATIATIIGNCGAITGGVIAGWASQYLGRRITMITCCIWTLIFLPLWLLPTDYSSICAGAFMLQMGVQGAWGVIPIYLTEISPVSFRSTFPGVAYQLGNMISSASAQIETVGGNNFATAPGKPNYGKVSTILIGVVAGSIILLCLVGSEAHGAHFERAKAAFESGAADDEILDEHSTRADSLDQNDVEKGEKSDKGVFTETHA